MHPLLTLPTWNLLAQWEKAQGDPRRLGSAFWNTYNDLLREYERIQNAPSGWIYELYPELKRTPGKGTVLSLTADLMLEHPELTGEGTGGLGVLKRDDTFAYGELFGPDNYFLCAPLYNQRFNQHIDQNGETDWIFKPIDKSKLPLELVKDEHGKPALIKVLYGFRRQGKVPPTQRWIYMQVWKGKMGKGNLLLLDTDVEENNSLDLRLLRYETLEIKKKKGNRIRTIQVPIYEKINDYINRIMGTQVNLYEENEENNRLLEAFLNTPEGKKGFGRYTHPMAALKHQLLKIEKNNLPWLPHQDRLIMERIYPFDNDGEPSQRQRMKQYIVLSSGSLEAFKLVNERRGIEWPSIVHLNDPHTAPLAAVIATDPRLKNIKVTYGNHTLAPGAGHQYFGPDNRERAHHEFSDPMWFVPGNDDEKVYHAFRSGEGVKFSQGAEALTAMMGRVHAVNNAEHVIEMIKLDKKEGKNLLRENENLVGVDNGVDFYWAADQFQIRWEGKRPEQIQEEVKAMVQNLSAEKLIDFKRQAKRELNEFLLQNEEHYNQAGPLSTQEKLIDPNKLLFVFSKRFTPYKRSKLVMDILDELAQSNKIKEGEEIQVIFSGKANDNDGDGEEEVKKVQKYEMEHRGKKRSVKVIYIPDYHIELSKKLLAASDFWLNTPQRHLEASGTSLLKAAMNASILISTQSGAAMNEQFFQNGVNALLVDVDRGQSDKANYNEELSGFRNSEVEEIERKQLLEFFIKAHDLFYNPERQKDLFKMRCGALSKIYEMSSLRQAIDQVQKTYVPLVFKKDFRKEVVRYGVVNYPDEGPRFEVEVNLGTVDPKKALVKLRYWDTSLQADYNWHIYHPPPDIQGSYREFEFTHWEEVPGKAGHFIFSGKPPFSPGLVQYVVYLNYRPNNSVYQPEFNGDKWVKSLREEKWVAQARGGWRKFDEINIGREWLSDAAYFKNISFEPVEASL